MSTCTIDVPVRADTRTREPVLIVGAGPAGLSAAAELGRVGVPAAILERSDAVASSWRGRYDRLRLNSPRLTSALPGSRFPKGTAQFPTRDQVVGYLEGYAEQHGLDVRFGVRLDRIDPGDGGWHLATSAGPLTAAEVVIATGFAHTPRLPDWPGRDRFPGRLLHSASYRNPGEFSGADVLVAGPGCSGMEIAYDLAQGGASRVRIAVRTQPNIMLRQAGGLPGDYPAMVLELLPRRIADASAALVRRLTVGDLSQWGLTRPQEGIFARLERERKAPAIVDIEVIKAIRAGELEIVAGVESVDEAGVRLADGTTLQPEAVIAATGYTSGLVPVVGHLGVLGANGVPQVHGGPAAAPGLRFIGYTPRPSQVGRVGYEARRAARQIKQEIAAAR